jgi:MFS family permease
MTCSSFIDLSENMNADQMQLSLRADEQERPLSSSSESALAATSNMTPKPSPLTSEKVNQDRKVSYFSLLRSNRPFSIFFVSYVIYSVGEWLTLLSSIEALNVIKSNQSATSVSILYVARLLPSVLFLPINVSFADKVDRRKNMIALNLIGALIALVYFLALRVKSSSLIYMATFLQGSVSAVYEPLRTSIVPMMNPDDDEHQKATYIMGMTRTVMATVGVAAGGIFVAIVGIEGCFCKFKYSCRLVSF